MKRKRNTILRVACFIVLAACAVFIKPDTVTAEDVAWYKDYMIYEFKQVNGVNYLDVCGYNGNSTGIYVPVYTTVDGVSYRTRIKGGISKKDLISIRFEQGVMLTGDCNYLFSGLKSLKTMNTEALDVSTVTNMNGMFSGCIGLSKLNLTTWDTSNVTDMGYMFYNCRNLKTLDLKKWDTSNVTNMSHMFNWCTGLEQVKLKGWNTSKVTNMDSLFSCAFSLKSVDLSTFDMGNVVFDKSNPLSTEMFLRCSSLKTIKTPKRLKTRIPISNLLTYKAKGTLKNYEFMPKGKKSITLKCNEKESKATKITKITSKKGKITLTWNALPNMEDGTIPQYEVQCSTNKNFTDNAGKMVKPISPGVTHSVEDDVTEKSTATIKKLEKGKVYYVRVRVCERGRRISKWSNVKKIKVK